MLFRSVLELYGLNDYVNKEIACPIEGVKKIPHIKDIEAVDDFIVKYSDIDINKHLNSMKYIEYFVDLFDLEMFRTKEIKRLEINYMTEACYGSAISLLKKKENENVFTLEMKDGETVVSTSRVLWS